MSFLVGLILGAIVTIVFLWKKDVINTNDVSVIIDDKTDESSEGV